MMTHLGGQTTNDNDLCHDFLYCDPLNVFADLVRDPAFEHMFRFGWISA